MVFDKCGSVSEPLQVKVAMVLVRLRFLCCCQLYVRRENVRAKQSLTELMPVRVGWWLQFTSTNIQSWLYMTGTKYTLPKSRIFKLMVTYASSSSITKAIRITPHCYLINRIGFTAIFMTMILRALRTFALSICYSQTEMATIPSLQQFSTLPHHP